MDREAKLKLAKGLLAEHVQDCLPPKSNKHIKDIDVVTIDALICGLVANLIKYGGEVVEVNSFYRESGVDKDFNVMIVDAQTILDSVLPQLRDEQSKNYFNRLSKMSVVAAEIGIAQQKPELEECGILSAEELKEERRLDEFRRTADLDLGLLEFRKQLARDKGLDVD